jgi:DinB family protein
MNQQPMAQTGKEIRDQVVSTLEGGQAHMSLAEATRAFPTPAINSRLPRVPYSFWHLVEHIRLAQKDMLDYMVSTSYEEPPFPQGYWPGTRARATSSQWRQSLAQFHRDRDAIIELVRDPGRDLFATVPNSAGKHTFFRCCLVIADHNSYHIGELAIGRQVSGLWPKSRED